MRFLTIFAYTKYLITFCQHTLIIITQVACLCGATWGAIFGVKIDNRFFT